MHIPDNYLSPETCAVMAAVMVPVVVYSAKKLKKDVEEKKETVPLMAISSSLSFLIMMFNIPLPGGTSAHAVGACLLALLIGPHAACISVASCLALQAFVFGDGGILALGANIFNMAFIMPFSGYYIYKICTKLMKKRGEMIGVALGSYLSINCAALCAAIELGIQPILFCDSLNNPLYNPYPVTISVPTMVGAHLLIGIVESIFTVSVYKIIKGSDFSSDKAEHKKGIKIKRFAKLIIALVILCPLGLIATGTAWGEWDVTELLETLKAYNMPQNVPTGMKNGFSFNALFSDYKMQNVPDIVGYILCAVTAVVIFMLFYKIIFGRGKNTNGNARVD
ncbi:cobalt transporter CbiM [Clostridium sp. BJN0001]|uniref:cobalt transporter CbiM n=1 Tax=Clostridium sp. BJN0001 TaxID=2930219 RepID=UPI001FD15558|nr:cobalt transporter CbiM [Clostridium sp. BJN0001]